MKKRDLIHDKNARSVLYDPLFFIPLNLIVFVSLIGFIWGTSNASFVYEQAYAKQVALLIDSAEPGMNINLDMSEGFDIARKNKVSQEEILRVDNEKNKVSVVLSNSGGYSYGFFSYVKAVVKPERVKEGDVENLFNGKYVIEISEEEVEQESEETGLGQETIKESEKVISDSEKILNVINYARSNVVGNRKCDCGKDCENYTTIIEKFSEKYGIDPFLLISLMMQESSCDKEEIGGTPDYGLMQVTKVAFEESCTELGFNFKREEILYPENNVDCGSAYLKAMYLRHGEKGIDFSCEEVNERYVGWEAAVRAYNGFGCRSDTKKYVEEVINRRDELKKVLNT